MEEILKIILWKNAHHHHSFQFRTESLTKDSKIAKNKLMAKEKDEKSIFKNYMIAYIANPKESIDKF